MGLKMEEDRPNFAFRIFGVGPITEGLLLFAPD